MTSFRSELPQAPDGSTGRSLPATTLTHRPPHLYPPSPAAPDDEGSVRIYHLLTDKAQSLREDIIIYLAPLKGVQK